jgi:hypothetical protein
VTEPAALSAVPDEDDGNVQVDVHELLEAYAKVSADQITSLLTRCAQLEAMVAAQQRQLAKRGR